MHNYVIQETQLEIFNYLMLLCFRQCNFTLLTNLWLLFRNNNHT